MLKCLDIMLDVETMGNSSKPVITQLAAVPFFADENKGFQEDAFDLLISPQSCAKVGLTCASETKGVQLTMDWWLTQDPAVFDKIVLRAFREGQDLKDVLLKFSQWIQAMKKKHGANRVKVWGRGPAADCVWVRSAYNACELVPPWSYWDDACVRTMGDMGIRLFNYDFRKEVPFEGDRHDGVADCAYQIKYVCNIASKMKK